LTSGFLPVTAAVKLTMRSQCHPGFWLLNQASSVGALLRTPTGDGVRWKTKSSWAASARRGTAWIEVAPVPMMPTRLSFRLVIGSVQDPPV